MNWMAADDPAVATANPVAALEERALAPARRPAGDDGVTPPEMEERLQRVMDQYAGGISSYYEVNEERLAVARRHLERLQAQTRCLAATDPHELMLAHEVMDRIDVAQALVEHLSYRKETRWPGFTTRCDYPHRDDRRWLKFVNSVRDRTTGAIRIVERPYEQLVPGDRYLPR